MKNGKREPLSSLGLNMSSISLETVKASAYLSWKTLRSDDAMGLASSILTISSTPASAVAGAVTMRVLVRSSKTALTLMSLLLVSSPPPKRRRKEGRLSLSDLGGLKRLLISLAVASAWANLSWKLRISEAGTGLESSLVRMPSIRASWTGDPIMMRVLVRSSAARTTLAPCFSDPPRWGGTGIPCCCICIICWGVICAPPPP